MVVGTTVAVICRQSYDDDPFALQAVVVLQVIWSGTMITPPSVTLTYVPMVRLGRPELS